MRAFAKWFFLAIVVVVAVIFIASWRRDTPLGVGTGNIGISGPDSTTAHKTDVAGQ